MDRTTTISEIWVYREPTWSSVDLSGFHVEAVDGEIGTVDNDTYEIGGDALVLKTGPWIFGKKVMLPVGVIDRIDEMDRRLWVNLTQDAIKSAPEFDDALFRDRTYRDELGTYYGTNRPAGPDYGRDDTLS
jgi:hypothetical protein